MITRSLQAGSVVVLTCLALTACGTESGMSDTAGQTTTEQTTAPDLPHDYVALGDSYAALGSRDAALSGPAFCRRSADNYPSQVLADARVTGQDVSCQGAVTDNLLRPRNTGSEEIPAQLDSLTEGTDLVTLSIGGNDIEFGGMAGCFGQAMRAGLPSDCAATWDGPARAQLAELPDALDQVHQAITDRSPDARVIVTGYMPLIAPGDDCTELAAISEADRAWAVALTDELNQVVADAAERHGADMVLPAGTGEHTGCAAPEQRWVAFHGNETGAYPMHPTPAGQAAMAETVLAEL
ncbi:SGNH/GDSL hydrolase family protein [Corynebacterium halotolerans]|uniref:SGNH hydrolase-type esterase domain-containing protein n=1 Tax=Corynebacterium halotolerans YIM 70093 = DSM 44683 TaxID=1121362 RepID=M1NU08_9CORY|nr:SGNH/GDSL hydrolase family protein [Corynebacterium halotolerans]AGF72957.1 hypothetical protein A605_09775 [Corynebacterium halotolerans YIM 70093 = DSM 44683]